MITYVKQSEQKEKWGIDVTVHFTDKDVNVTKTFTFKNQEQIDNDFAARMVKAIENIEHAIAERKKPQDQDIAERILKHFATNTSMSKAEYENIKNTELTRKLHG